MPAPVPVEIDTVAVGVFQQNFDNLFTTANNGCSASRSMWAVGSHLYALLDSNPFGNIGQMYKSIDGGLTWTVMDQPHGPGVSDGFALGGHLKCYIRGTKIQCVWVTKPAAIAEFVVGTFDTGADVWLSESGVGPANVVSTVHTQIVVLSTGDRYIIGFGGTGGVAVAFLKLTVGGVWDVASTPINTPAAGTSSFVKAVYVDSTDKVHIFYQEVTAAGATLFYVQLSGGVISGLTTVVTHALAGEFYQVGEVTVSGGKLQVPYARGSDNVMSLAIGSNLTAPSFSVVIIDPLAATIPVSGQLVDPFSFTFPSGTVQLFWNANNSGGTNDSIYSAINSGAGFGAPFLFYSNAANPFPGQSVPSIQDSSSAVIIPTGTVSVLSDCVTTNNNASNFVTQAFAPLKVSVASGIGTGALTLPSGLGVLCRFARPYRRGRMPYLVNSKTVVFINVPNQSA